LRQGRPLSVRDHALEPGVGDDDLVEPGGAQVWGDLAVEQQRRGPWRELMEDSAQPSYEAVARLSDDQQRELLATGSAVERLWAAWALGLRAGADAVPDLQLAAASAAVPGLRAHLVIVLAGLGERQLVETFALNDPDALVRAAAGEHLLRTVSTAASPAHEPAVDQLLRDPSADVRLVVLRELLRLLAQRDLPLPATGDLERLAHDPEPAVRWLALEMLATLPADEPVVTTLERRLAVEPEHELRCWLAARVIAAGGARAVLGLVVGDASERDEDLLRTLEDTAQRFTWDELAHLTIIGEPKLDAHLLALLSPVDRRALSWLLACAIRADRGLLALAKAAEALLDRLLPHLRSRQLTQREQDQARKLLGLTERRLAEAEQWIVEEYHDLLDESSEPIDAVTRAELDEIRAGDWYRAHVGRAQELRRLIGNQEQSP
jgi:hypothetical protein